MGETAASKAGAGVAGELRGRLLAEAAEEVGRPLQLTAPGRVGPGEQADGEAEHDRVHTGLIQPDPGNRGEQEVDEAGPDASGESGEDEGEGAGRDRQRHGVDRPAVGSDDDRQGDDVVDDDDRQHETAQAVGEAGTDQGEHAEREGGVGRHRHSPALGRGVAGVEGEEDRDRDEHAAEGGEDGQGEAAALAQLADVELAPHLEPDDKEEERHQAAVDPLAQALGDARAADLDREGRVPGALIGGEVEVGPGEGRHRGREQDAGAAGLGGEEVAQRRLQAARPGGAPAECRPDADAAHRRQHFIPASGSTI